MSSITVKDIPASILDRLRAQAKQDRRSLNKELIHLVEKALDQRAPNEAERVQMQVSAQTQAWSKLAGQWVSDLDLAAETRAIYDARSPGRRIEF